MEFRITRHAKEELARRDIPMELLKSVLDNPQQIVLEKIGRKAYQSKIDFGEGKIYLLRAIVQDDVRPAIVITIYKTSRISKYWRSK